MILRPSIGEKLSFALATLLVALSSASTAQASTQICQEFQRLERAKGWAPYELKGAPLADGKERIPDLDIDGDGLIDDVVWFCPGSGSAVPADPCTLTIKLASGKTVEFSHERLVLVRYGSKVYVRTTEVKPSNARLTPQIQRRIFRVEGSGLTLICDKL